MQKAEALLDGISALSSEQDRKNIVIFTSGFPDTGTSTESGRYTSEDHSICFGYANTVCTTATSIHEKGYALYALCSFESLPEADSAFAQKVMTEISDKDCCYSIVDTNKFSASIDQICAALLPGEQVKKIVTLDGLTEEENVSEEYSDEDIVYALEEFQQMPMLLADTPDLIRYTVLILDTSGSMSGTPFSVQKAAAIKFCNSVLDAGGINYVAIVKLNSSSSVSCSFSCDIDTLKSVINSGYASGGTNTNQALQKAKALLDAIPNDAAEKVIKNIVLCSDGLPESGDTVSYTHLRAHET